MAVDVRTVTAALYIVLLLGLVTGEKTDADAALSTCSPSNQIVDPLVLFPNRACTNAVDALLKVAEKLNRCQNVVTVNRLDGASRYAPALFALKR